MRALGSWIPQQNGPMLVWKTSWFVSPPFPCRNDDPVQQPLITKPLSAGMAAHSWQTWSLGLLRQGGCHELEAILGYKWDSILRRVTISKNPSGFWRISHPGRAVVVAGSCCLETAQKIMLFPCTNTDPVALGLVHVCPGDWQTVSGHLVLKM